jgi:hypothetical protein
MRVKIIGNGAFGYENSRCSWLSRLMAQTSAISGRVTVEGKPAARVLVVLLPGARQCAPTR